MKLQILSEPMDIEDLVNAGKKCGACPYYASRKAAKDAQLVLVPYNTILHSGTREGVGLKVNKSVILLDEAHNLIESISNMYSNSITFQQLQDCSNALKSYMTRYMSRSSTKNLLKLKQIAFVLKSLLQFVGELFFTGANWSVEFIITIFLYRKHRRRRIQNFEYSWI